MNILSLQSSINGDASTTRKLSAAYIAQIRAHHSAVNVTEHDLVAEAFPHLSADMVAVTFGIPHDPSAASGLSDRLIAELEQSDIIVFGSPMYNFGVPTTIKAWFDHVMRVGRTFRYVDGSPEGLLPAGKKAIVFVASGGVYSNGPGQQIDFMEPHLRWMLQFIGITDVTFVRAEGLAYGPDVAQAANNAAMVQAKELALTA
ncbi:FMN-dependent NADH-azoreductase AzoR [Janthinobacterium sp. HH01]|uniref:FMN-dependent NADH-azoreductase n=1 Tax=Janthinobacterium sp. HH01 TaxID=1198452 RepID=UPI0002AED38D|nr:NAD(P)H-dependent oxidoreductase [Janthinobacterium sp. HH01]ELX09064.1 FMN-dependent NADH-azoreductase AzoR [Janthinobacterium sp. HH01]